jgi:integrase
MPKKAAEQSAKFVRDINTYGHYAVGGVSGLLLQVSKTGAKSWILRTMIGSKRRDIGLGGFPDVSLSNAREKARIAKDKIANGIDPIAERKALRAQLRADQASLLTFDEAARKVHKIKANESRNPKHAAQWISTLENYASPVIGKLPVSAVELNHIVSILEPIWLTKTETARRLRQRLEAVLAWSTVSGFRKGDNPARWKENLDHILPKPGKIQKIEHHAALPIDAMPEFMRELRHREGLAAKALELLILTATRSGEVRGAKWDEIDMQSKIWVIPDGRMKAGKEHRIPLSDNAIKLLQALPRLPDNNLVFPAARGGIMSDMTMLAVMKRMKVDAVVHGFRSTFRDWAAERTNYPREVCEHALAHQLKDKAEAAYQRSDMLEKRAMMMQDWANFINTLVSPSSDKHKHQ